MSKTRKVYSNNFRSKVALEALRGEKTLQELAAQYGVSSKQIGRWRQVALDSITNCFSNDLAKKDVSHEREISALHSKIGQLVVERDFLLRASNLLGLSGGKR